MRSTRIRAVLAAATTTALLSLLAGCGYPQGPAGRVVDKDKDYKASTKSWKYELTTRGKDSQEHEFRVTRRDYSRCYLGSSYPRCTEVDR